MKFPRQECWSGVPFTTPGDLPDPGNKSESLAPPVLAAGFFTPEPPGSPSHPTPGTVQGGECCFCGFSLSAQATAVSTSHIPEKEVNMLLWETSKKTKCALIFFKHHPCREGGQKEAKVEKYGKPIENVSTSPVPLNSPILQHNISAAHVFNKIPL